MHERNGTDSKIATHVNFNSMKNESCATWCCLGTFPLTYQGALVLFLRVAHDMFTVHEGDEM